MTIPAGYAHSLALATPPPVRAATTATPIVSRTAVLAATDSAQLFFNAPLDAELASDPARYVVTVDGRDARVESEAYNSTNHSVTLGLRSGDLSPGATVTITWQRLHAVGSGGTVGPLTAH